MIKLHTLILLSCGLFLFVSQKQDLFSQQKSTVVELKKWFKTALKDIAKDKQNFTSKYCKLPFLTGSGGDGYYSYSLIEQSDEMLGLLEEYLVKCKKEFKNEKNITFTEIVVSDSTLGYLANSLEFNERDLDGNKVNPDAKPPYHGLIADGTIVYSISYGCGEIDERYETQVSYELYIVFDKESKSYRFWASTSGL
jgi:hypothetical protein